MKKLKELKAGIRMIIIVLVLLVATLSILFITRLVVRAINKDTTKISTENGIDGMFSMSVGGVEQWLYIRGENKENPVLLWLEGGPGEPLSAYCRDIGQSTGIEKDFTVIYWDQRGSGKSCGSKFKEKDFTFDRYVLDIHEITKYAKKRFNCEKIYLLGRSWGSEIGIKAANDYPDDYFAYIGVGQVTDNYKISKARLDFVYKHLMEDKQSDKAKGVKEMMEAYDKGEPVDWLVIQPYVEKYKGFSYSGRDGIVSYSIKSLLSSPEYTVQDIINTAKYMGYSIECLEKTKLPNGMLDIVETMQTPCYFFLGRHDRQVSSKVAEMDIALLQSTSIKEIIWFENSAHVVNDDEPKAFYEKLLYVKEATYQIGE